MIRITILIVASLTTIAMTSALAIDSLKQRFSHDQDPTRTFDRTTTAPGAAKVGEWHSCRFEAPLPLLGLVRALGRQRCTAEAPAACVSYAVPSSDFFGLRGDPGGSNEIQGTTPCKANCCLVCDRMPIYWTCLQVPSLRAVG
jgi:hypothetical protein